MIVDEVIVNTNRNLLRIEDELVNDVTEYREGGIITKVFTEKVESILSKNTSDLLYRFTMLYNRTDVLNKHFKEIQFMADKGEDILKLQEYYYLTDILVNETKAIKINYVIRRINYLFSSYNILPTRKELIRREVERYIDLNKKTIFKCNLYNSLNKIALELVLNIAELFNLKIKQAI